MKSCANVSDFAHFFCFLEIVISKLGKGIGYGGAVLGVLLDAQGVRNYYNPKYGPNSPNSVSPAKAGLNTGMSAYGLWVNSLSEVFK